MHSVAAAWRLSLRRTRADWPIVAAAWLITLLATILFAAGPIYSSAAALAGLRRTLADAPATQSSVDVGVYGTPAYAAGIDEQVKSELQQAVSPLSAQIVRDGRDSATLSLPDRPSGQAGDQALIGFLDGLPDHAHLTAGAWPQAGGAADPLQVVVLDAVASDLQLSVGDELSLAAPSAANPVSIPVRVVGTFAANDLADPFWYGDTQLTGGIVQGSGGRVLGPFLTTPEGILQNAALTSVHVHWRAFPNFDGLTIDNVAGIHQTLNGLAARLPKAPSGSLVLTTGLPDILGSAERSLLVSRTEMLLLMAQLAIVAAYAIVLTASLLVDHRRIETALMRSRGAGSAQVFGLAFAEALVLVVPSVIVAPWLAVAEASLLNFAGPLADVGLRLEPSITTDSYLLAAAAGLLCLVLLVLPAFFAARNFTSEERELSRQETRTFAQRVGLDIVLLAVSIIALWQLSLYGAPLTRTVQGSLGFDPLLVAAPALGLLAGGILALRVLPLLAAGMEKVIGRGREIVASLGSRHLARRPLRYTRTALLLMLALSLGVFALSYAATWSGSQQDQADYQAGADVRAVVGSRTSSPPMVASAYEAIPGVAVAMPVERIANGVSPAKGSVDVLALDAGVAGPLIHFRSDEAAQPLEQLMQPLRDGRPAPQLLTLPPDATALRVNTVLKLNSIEHFGQAPPGQPIPSTPIDPATVTDIGLTATALIRDAHGVIHRIGSEQASINGADGGAQLLIPLLPTGSNGAARAQVAGPLDGPLQLVGLQVDVARLPAGSQTSSGAIGASSIAVSSSTDGPWTDLPLDSWVARMAPGNKLFQPVPSDKIDGMTVQLDGRGYELLVGGNVSGRALFIASAIDSLDIPIPVIANSAFLATVGAAQGQTVNVSMDGERRALSVTGVVDTFPTTDPTRPLLVVDGPTLDLLRLRATSATRDVDEWWMSVAPGQSAAVAAAMRTAAFDHKDVVSATDRARSLSTDPVALGIIGALLLGFVATGIFALVALVVSAAVSARQRRTEFALLRALGLSSGQLSRWLWLENGSLVLVSLIAGTAVGVVISLVALPFITVTQQAAAPLPAVVVQLPWDRILMLDLIVVVALGVAVGVLAATLRRIGIGSILRLGED